MKTLCVLATLVLLGGCQREPSKYFAIVLAPDGLIRNNQVDTRYSDWVCMFDNQPKVGDYVEGSTSVPSLCHDSGISAFPKEFQQ